MAEWEYLLQKEGDRSWLPLKLPRMEIPEGRYRIVAHSNRANTDVELRITHYCIDEVPPKRRFQKRSHRTNSEGLMVVIPFTYIKPGIWDLLLKNEIMSDLLGDTWQEGIQLQVLPKVTQTHDLPAHLDETTNADLGAGSVRHASDDPALPIKSSPVQTEVPTPTPKEQIAVPLKPLVALDLERNQQSRRTEKNATPVPSDELAGLAQPDKTTVSVNELLADSLQVAEQVFQQLVDQVWQESEPTPEDQSIERGNGTQPRYNPDRHVGANAFIQPQRTAWLPTDNKQEAQTEDSNLLTACASVNQPALLLNLDQETLVAHRGQSLQMTGRVDVPDTTAPGSRAIESNLNSVFQGTLLYQLRDPQNSQVLVSDQISLPEQVPPYAFSFTFALPPNCETRLILGEVTLCDHRGMFIATRPFSITPDLQELLGTIVQKPQGAPTEQTAGAADPVLQANQPEPRPETFPDRNEESINLDLYFLNLVDQVKNPQSFQPATGQLLPPQITPPSATKKVSKSPKLPKLPSIRLSGPPSITDTLAAHDSLCVQAMPPEGIKDEAGSISQELVNSNSTHPHLTYELKETLPANGHKVQELQSTSKNTSDLQLSEDLGVETSDIQIESVNTASSSLLLTQDQVFSDELDVWDLPQTQNSQVVTVEADNAPEAGVDFGLESTEEEQKATDVANSVNLELGSNLGEGTVTPQHQVATGEQPKLEKLEVIDVVPGAEHRQSYLPDPPLPTALAVPSSSGVVDASTDALRSLTKLPTREEDQPELLPPSIPSNWQEDWAEFLSTSVPLSGEEDHEELLSGGEQQESQNPKFLEQQVQSELEIQQPSKEEAAPVESPVDQAFQALRMEERFWLRLNTMATDADLSEWIRSEHSLNSPGEVDLAIDELPPDTELETLKVDTLPPLEPDTATLLTGTNGNGAFLAEIGDFEDNFSPQPHLPATPEQAQSIPALSSGTSAEAQKLVQSTEPPSEDSLHPETADATASLPDRLSQEAQNQSHLSLNDVGLDWNTQEIVVDDELPAPSQSAHTNPTLRVDDSYSSEPLAVFQLFEEVLVPTPELNVREGELTCGELLTLRVKLPPDQNPIYVKLWIQDRQSRSLLDGPRLLKDFSPTASGELEALAQLNVPFGSLSIRFEAIAINMYTQRESHKVMVDRIVVPPDIPTISLDEFED